MTQAGSQIQVQRVKPKVIADMADHQVLQMKARSEKAKENAEHLKAVTNELQKALNRGDVDRAGILAADFESARRSVSETTKDLAQVMVALGQQYKEIGIEIDALKSFTSEEQKLIDDANRMLPPVEAELHLAQTGLNEAERKSFNLFGSRDRAITRAKERLETATERIQTAHAGIRAAQELAAQKQRERLINADLNTSMQRIQLCTQNAIDNALSRIGSIEEDVEGVKAALAEGTKNVEVLTSKIEELDKTFEGFESQLRNLREQLNETQKGTEEYAQMESEITRVTQERDEAQNERTKNFMILQEQERFIASYKLHVAGQQQFLAHHHAWVATLEMGVKERNVLFDSQIGAMQAIADQQAMKTVDDIASSTDERFATEMAKMVAAGQDALLKRVKRAPEDLKKLREIVSASTERRAQFENDLDTVLDEFKQNYGVDPNYDSVAGHRAAEVAS